MEKFIKTISTIMTSILFYVLASYFYLSAKGFVYDNGTFTLVKTANASALNKPTGFANKIDENIALNFKSALNKPTGFANKIDENIALNFKDDKAHGDKNAPLTLYEFSSLGCSHCAKFHLDLLPKLENDFISQGKLKVVFINFPLEAKSMKGAILSECLNPQQREAFLNTVFLKQREWMLSYKAEEVLSKYAIDENFTEENAKECLQNDALEKDILADRQEAIDKLKMQGTPAFLFSSNGLNEIIYGVPEYEKLKLYIEDRLK